MVVLSITNCPPGLRGDLSKWLNEINTGVYIGKLSARVREKLWERICENIRDGQATMIYSASNAQGYKILVHNTSWKPRDFDGITLMQRPLKDEKSRGSDVKEGFSKAAKYEKAKRAKSGNSKKKPDDSYVILDLETTGLEAASARIIEIGMLKIVNEEIEKSYQCYILQEHKIPDMITRMTGISDEVLESEGIDEKRALEELQKFIGSSTVVGYNIKFDMDFIAESCRRLGMENHIRKTKDILRLARRKIDDIKNYKLETVATYFGITMQVQHRALSDCEVIYGIYSKLNEI